MGAPQNNLNALTVVLLMILTIMSMYVTDLGLMNAIGGGTLATAIVFVFPTIMYRRAVHKLENDDHLDEVAKEWHQVNATTFVMVFGVVLGVVGVYESLQAASNATEGR